MSTLIHIFLLLGIAFFATQLWGQAAVSFVGGCIAPALDCRVGRGTSFPLHMGTVQRRLARCLEGIWLDTPTRGTQSKLPEHHEQNRYRRCYSGIHVRVGDG